MSTNRFDDIPDEDLAGMEQIADAALAPDFKFLVWRYPEFKIGEFIATDSEWIALTDESSWGHVCWSKDPPRRLLGEHTVKAVGSKKPPRPNTFTNKDDWELIEKGPNGAWRKDCWEWREKLPLFSVQTKKVVVFTGDSAFTSAAIARLFADFRKTKRRPLVVLTTIPQEDDPNKVQPFFEIIEHTEHTDKIMGTALARDIDEIVNAAAPAKTESQPAQANGVNKPSRPNDDMEGDSIPF